MVTTRKRGKDKEIEEEIPQIREEEQYDSGSDSDDAPEEVAFTKSKQSAAKLRKQQQEAKKEAERALKEKRKRRQQQKEKPPPPEGDEENDEEEEGEEELDMLPEDVIDAVANDEGYDRRMLERRVISEQLRGLPEKRQRQTFTEQQVGPVVVKVLKPGMNRNPSEAAQAFLQQRLHNGVKRSNEMLQPTKIGGVFVRGPKAK